MRLVLPWFLLSLAAAGCSHAPTLDDDPPLVFEATDPAPVRYRVVPELRASGSGVFTPKNIQTIVGGAKGPITFIDLRREPHGFVNGEPVTWSRDRGTSAGVSYDDVIARETDLLLSVRGEETMERIPASGATSSGGLPKVQIQSVRSERDIVESAGHRYRRLAVSETQPPDDADVDRFLKIVKALPPKAWVHFSCRDGGNRTLDFLILYDMVRNASRTPSYAEIVARQEKLANASVAGGGAVEAGRYAVDRERFFQRFHEYARAFPDGGGPGWRTWLNNTK